MSFRRRLTLACAAAVTLAVALAAGLTYWFVRDALRDQIDGSLREAQQLATRLPEPAGELADRLERAPVPLRSASPLDGPVAFIQLIGPGGGVKAAAKTAFTSLFLGLGAVALLVGGVGIANVMVISVLERRSEVGLRRALGARRRHVGAQFLCESLLLAAGGGLAGVALGALVTAGYARSQEWTTVIPPGALAGGLVAAIAIGAVAGCYPALRAARLAPTEALRGI